MPARFLINPCQIITFLILKSNIIENSRIELREIVLTVPSNQIKVTFIIILPFNLVHLCFFLLKLKEKVGGLLGGEAKCMLPPPPLKVLGACPPPLPASPSLPTHMVWYSSCSFHNTSFLVPSDPTTEHYIRCHRGRHDCKNRAGQETQNRLASLEFKVVIVQFLRV